MKHLAGKPFTIIGVNSDRSLDVPKKLVEEGTVTWRSFQNDGNETKISEDWGVTGWPTIYLLDAEGKIRYKNVRGPKLDEAIATLMEEMGEEFPADEIAAEVEKEKAEKAAKKAAALKAKVAREAKEKAAKEKAEKAKQDKKDDDK